MPAPARPVMPDSYFALVRRFPLVRIADDEELADALAVLEELLAIDRDAGQEAYLGALCALVRFYEDEHHPIPDAAPSEVLRELAAAGGMTGADVARATGIVPSTVSALMSGKRRPTADQVAALAALFRVGPAAFLPRTRPAEVAV